MPLPRRRAPGGRDASSAYLRSLAYRGCKQLSTLRLDVPLDGLTVVECHNLAELPPLDVSGSVTVARCDGLRRFLPGGRVGRLQIEDCPNLEALPAGLEFHELTITRCSRLTRLAERMRGNNLVAEHSALVGIGEGLAIQNLHLSDSGQLRELPSRLRGGTIVMRRCNALESLPGDVRGFLLDVGGCERLSRWDEGDGVVLHTLNLAGCRQMTDLPRGIDLRMLDLADSGLTRLRPGLRDVQLLWRGMRIDRRIAFDPDSITVAEVLAAPNVESRRVLMQRMGYDRFLRESRATVIDRDLDAGGERALLRIEWIDDEPLVCLAVVCPSTRRRYTLRVPPGIATCRQAVAWIAGFGDPNEYRPIAET